MRMILVALLAMSLTAHASLYQVEGTYCDSLGSLTVNDLDRLRGNDMFMSTVTSECGQYLRFHMLQPEVTIVVVYTKKQCKCLIDRQAHEVME